MVKQPVQIEVDAEISAECTGRFADTGTICRRPVRLYHR